MPFLTRSLLTVGFAALGCSLCLTACQQSDQEADKKTDSVAAPVVTTTLPSPKVEQKLEVAAAPVQATTKSSMATPSSDFAEKIASGKRMNSLRPTRDLKLLVYPAGNYILVIDASQAQLQATTGTTATLSIPLNKITQVGQFAENRNTIPTYYTGQDGQVVWFHTEANVFANSRAVLSSLSSHPVFVKVTAEYLNRGTLEVELKTFQPLQQPLQLNSIVLSINGSN
jgi:hypothetical protein